MIGAREKNVSQKNNQEYQQKRGYQCCQIGKVEAIYHLNFRVYHFRQNSNGYIALDKQNSNRVVDIRYSLLPQEIQPLWGIELSPTAKPDDYVKFYNERGDSGSATKRLWGMLWE